MFFEQIDVTSFDNERIDQSSRVRFVFGLINCLITMSLIGIKWRES